MQCTIYSTRTVRVTKATEKIAEAREITVTLGDDPLSVYPWIAMSGYLIWRSYCELAMQLHGGGKVEAL